MKSNEITEGPLDLFRNISAAASNAGKNFKQNQAIDRQIKVNAATVRRSSSYIAKMWNNHERRLPNRAELYNNPNAYYNELSKFAAKELGNFKLPPGLQLPDMINPQNTSNLITQVTQKALALTPSAPAAAPDAAPAEAEPKPKQSAANQYGAMTAQVTPKATPATPKPAPPMSMGGKDSASYGGGQSYTPSAAAVPKAGTPVPGMSGYVYTGKMGANGKPQAIKSAPATPTATDTLPTKTKSKTNPRDIDIDAALKIADGLNPEEKKKLLQDLLKSGVKVSAGGA